MIYAIEYTLADYINIILVYHIILKKKLKKKKAIWISSLAVILAFQGIIAFKYGLEYANIISIIGGISIPFLMFQGKRKTNVLLYLPTCIGIYLINKLCEIFVDILDVYFNKRVILETLNTMKNANTSFSFLLLKFNVLFIVCIVYMMQNLIKNIRKYLIILLGFISYCILIVFARMLGEVIKNKETLSGGETQFYFIRAEYINILWIAISILFIVLCIWQIVTIKKEEEYCWQNEAYSEYIKMQEESIKKIIEKDQNMRRFRHDMYAHIVALESISNRVGDKQFQEYVEKMRENSAIYSVKDYSGITAVDAVVSEIEARARGFQVSIQWKGNLKGNNKIAIFDLCTVFSNLLTNAVEACKKLEEKEKIINVKTYCFENNIYINVGNPCNEKVIIGEDGEIETTKSDKESHGFGIKNVKDTVKRNKGSIQYVAEDKWFEVKIVM